jgi:hypothetical protein
MTRPDQSDQPASEASADEIPWPAGIFEQPAVFRAIARAANQAGLDGREIIDVWVGVNRAAFESAMAEAARNARDGKPTVMPEPVIGLSYRRR